MTSISPAATSVTPRTYTVKELSKGMTLTELAAAHPEAVRKLSPDEMKQQSLLSGPTFDFLTSLAPGTASNDVSKIWGNIEVGGKVVAQIYSSGVMTGKAGYELPEAGRNTDDPAGRARAMIEAYGGKLVTRSQMKNPQLFMG